MNQSNQSFNIPPETPHPGIWTFEDWLVQIPSPSGQRGRSNAPLIGTKIPLLKEKFRLQSNAVHTFQRELCRDDTSKLLLKTLLKELFTNKGEILSCKSVKPCKNRKNSREYYARTKDKSSSISPPFQGNVQISPSPGTMHSQMPGACPEGDVEASIWPVDTCNTRLTTMEKCIGLRRMKLDGFEWRWRCWI